MELEPLTAFVALRTTPKRSSKKYVRKRVEQPPLEYILECTCKKKCLQRIPFRSRREHVRKISSLKTKNERDNYLQNLIVLTEPQRRRIRTDIEHRVKDEAPRRVAIVYHISTAAGDFPVCKTGFMNICAISWRQTQRLCELKQFGRSPTDKRGRQPAVNKKSPATVQLVVDFIGSKSVKESHYYTGNKKFYFTDKELLNLTKLFLEFKKKYPSVSVSQSFFESVFREKYALRFGKPQVDTCCFCEEIDTKLQDPTLTAEERASAIITKAAHKKLASKFHAKMREIAEKSKTDPTTLGISIDFMSNLSLPLIPVQEAFYLSKLTVNVFAVSNFKTNRTDYFLYDELVGGKGPNEVCSMLLQYINELPSSIKHLFIFTDGCAAQNRNHTICRFLCVLSQRFTTLRQYLPVRGHSFLLNDREFAVAKRNLAKVDRVYNLQEYLTLIANAPKAPNRFAVRVLKREDILQFKTFWQNHYKKKVIAEESRKKAGQPIPPMQTTFDISRFYDFEFSATGVKARNIIDGALTYTFKLKKPGVQLCPLPTRRVKQKRKLESSLLQGLQSLFKYVPKTRANMKYWKTVL